MELEPSYLRMTWGAKLDIRKQLESPNVAASLAGIWALQKREQAAAHSIPFARRLTCHY